jgi:hypothetical protein
VFAQLLLWTCLAGVQLQGRVLVRGVAKPVAGAQVSVGDVEMLTGATGRFHFDDLPEGQIRVVIEAPGFERADVPVEIGRTPSLVTVYLMPVEGGGYETVSHAPLQTTLPVTVLDRDEFTEVAGARGDPLLALQALPTLGRGPLGLGLLSIHGASPDEARFFVDGLEVPFVFHWGGLATSLPADVVGSVELFPGTQPPEFRPALAGAVDARARDGNTDVPTAQATLSPLSGDLTVEGPPDERSSGLVSGRRSFIDLLFYPVIAPLLGLSGSDYLVPRSADYFGRFTVHRGETTVRVEGFGSQDAIAAVFQSAPSEQSHQTVYRESYDRVLVKVDTAIDHVKLSVTPYGGTNYRDFGFNGLDRVREEDLGGLQLKAEVPFGASSFVAGFDGVGGSRRLNLQEPFPTPVNEPNPVAAPIFLSSDSTRFYLDAGAYVAAHLVLGRSLELTPALRVDRFSTATGVYASPQASALWRTGLGDVHASVGLSAQPPTPEQVDPVLGAGPLPAGQATQASLSIERPLLWGISASVSAWGRWAWDLVQLNLSVDPLVEWEEIFGYAPLGPVHGGASERAAGIDVMLMRHRAGRWFGWMAYSFSTSQRRETSGESWYPSPFDQPQAFTLVGGAALGYGWDASVRFRISSGHRYTPVDSAVFDADRGVYYPTPGEPFSKQLPPFHELDLRIEKRFTFNKGIVAIFLDIENVYDYLAPEGAYYNSDYSQLVYVRGLPIIPFLGLRGQM